MTTYRPGLWTDTKGIVRDVADRQLVPSQQIDPTDCRNLWHVARIQAELDAATELLVLDARAQGKSWAWIGGELGVSKQAAAKRWSYLDDVELDQDELPAELVDAVHAGAAECAACQGQGGSRRGSSGRFLKCKACGGAGVR